MPIFVVLILFLNISFLVMADSFLNALDCYVSHTTAVAIILGLFYDHTRAKVLPLV